jgi:primosomal protein N' (replication factor Y)
MSDGGQVILFLNLRGFSTMLWCQNCSAGVKCPDCDVTLTWHKDRQRVLCHSCEFNAPKPRECLHCGTPGLRFLGAGTQRLEEEVRSRFPDHTVVRMDSDSMRKPGSHDTALDAFRHGTVDILLGTQMIAKGLDFPNVTLVGVVDADSMLHQPDMRAAERTFQLVAQVAGRTGRGEKGGRVIVQTACPDEPVIRFAARHDYYGFAKQELKNRHELDLPPFSHLARIILRGPVEQTVQSEARRISDHLRQAIESSGADVKVVGPAPAPLLKLRQNYRYHCRLQAEQIEDIRELWNQVSPKLKPESDVELTIDVDPLDMR